MMRKVSASLSFERYQMLRAQTRGNFRISDVFVTSEDDVATNPRRTASECHQHRRRAAAPPHGCSPVQKLLKLSQILYGIFDALSSKTQEARSQMYNLEPLLLLPLKGQSKSLFASRLKQT